MPKAPPEMAVITKVYDLVLWSCQHIEKFPRSYRFTLGDRLEIRLYEVLEKLLRAKYSRDRLPVLRDVNMDLELVRFQFRMAKDLKCLSVDSYGYASRTVNEVGQLLGGWIKATLAKPAGRSPSGPGGADETPRRSVGAPDQLPAPAAGVRTRQPRQA